MLCLFPCEWGLNATSIKADKFDPFLELKCKNNTCWVKCDTDAGKRVKLHREALLGEGFRWVRTNPLFNPIWLPILFKTLENSYTTAQNSKIPLRRPRSWTTQKLGTTTLENPNLLTKQNCGIVDDNLSTGRFGTKHNGYHKQICNDFIKS